MPPKRKRDDTPITSPASSPSPPLPFDPLEDMLARTRAKFVALGSAATSKNLHALESKPRSAILARPNSESRELVRRAPLGRELVEGKGGKLVRNRVWVERREGCEEEEEEWERRSGDEVVSENDDGGESSTNDEDDVLEPTAVFFEEASADVYPRLRSAGKPAASTAFLNAPRPGTVIIPGGKMTVAYGHAAIQSGLEALEWSSRIPPAVTTYLSDDGVLAIAVTGRKSNDQNTSADTPRISTAKLKAATKSFSHGKTLTSFPALHAALGNMAWEPYTETHLIMTTTLSNGVEAVVIMGHQYTPIASENADEVEIEFGRTVDVQEVLGHLASIASKARLRAQDVLLLSSSEEEGEAGGGGEEEDGDDEDVLVPQKKKRCRFRGRKRRVKAEAEAEEEEVRFLMDEEDK